MAPQASYLSPFGNLLMAPANAWLYDVDQRGVANRAVSLTEHPGYRRPKPCTRFPPF